LRSPRPCNRTGPTPVKGRRIHEAGTEPPFTGIYWDHSADGTYRCICCESPLFDSAAKVDADTGLPTFTAPIDAGAVREQDSRPPADAARGPAITCATCGSYLGSLARSGPAARASDAVYVINSLALDFERRR